MLQIIKYRYYYLGFTALLLIFSLSMLFFVKLNLWIDMTWWTQNEYSYEWELNIEKLRVWVEKLKDDFNSKNNWVINWISTYKVSWEEKIVVETWFNKVEDEKILEWVKTDFNWVVLEYLKSENNSFILNKYQNIGQSFWEYIQKTAYLTLWISMIAISIYLWFAFYWVAVWISALSFWWVVLITLFHDAVVSAWLYIFTSTFLPEFKVDTYFITAILTILWYSINDTIVVFDRIRENIKHHVKTKKLAEIIDLSINETLARSIFTSLTLFFVLLTIFFFWPESLKWFMLTLIYWVVFWTFSSIFVAAPILYELNKNNSLQVFEKKIVKDEDKIIV